MSNSLWPHERQHARLPCSSPSPRACSNSCPLSGCCHPVISSSVVPFSSCLPSFPASRSFPKSWLFSSGGQSIETSTSASVLTINIQGWFPLGLTGLISLQSKGLSRLFSNTTAQKHHFFSAQPSLWSKSHIHTWILEKLIAIHFRKSIIEEKCIFFLLLFHICSHNWARSKLKEYSYSRTT